MSLYVIIGVVIACIASVIMQWSEVQPSLSSNYMVWIHTTYITYFLKAVCVYVHLYEMHAILQTGAN